MKIAADFDKRVVVHYRDVEWLTSPMPGVERKPLDRVGEEVARATSIVKYAPGSQFSPHVHTGGEEFIVLEGVFQDEHGDFPAGSYIRNPPQSSHTPGSAKGCTIFVKLWQFQPSDRTHVKLQIEQIQAQSIYADENKKNGKVAITPLYKDNYEDVCVVNMPANTTLTWPAEAGVELIVLSGEVTETKDKLVKYSWLRSPIHSKLTFQTNEESAKIWIKTGNVIDVENQILRLKNAV